MDKQEKIKGQVKSAMTYPIIVTVVGIIVIWGMMVFVVPQFVESLNDSNQTVPWITQLVINISDLLRHYFLITLVAVVVCLFFIVSYIKTDMGKLHFDVIMMKLPILGGILNKSNFAAFSRTLSTMLTSGIPINDSLDSCIETVDNKVMVRDLKELKNRVLKGGTLTDSFTRINYFPDMVTQMIRVGEQTGQIDVMLKKVSDVFEEEVKELIGRFTDLIGPIVIVVLGACVGGILVAVYLPIFMSASAVQ